MFTTKADMRLVYMFRKFPNALKQYANQHSKHLSSTTILAKNQPKAETSNDVIVSSPISTAKPIPPVVKSVSFFLLQINFILSSQYLVIRAIIRKSMWLSYM